MRYKVFGKTGEKVSVIGIGTWQAGLKSWGKDYTLNDVINAIKAGIEHGVNFIDTAEVYGNGRSESVVGEIIKEYGEELFIATKVAGYNATPNKVFKAAIKSRDRLKVDAIDLYQVHWPPSRYTDICGLAKALEKLVDDGVIRYIGVSNFDLISLNELRMCMKKYDIISNQLHYNLLNRNVEREIYPYMKREGIELIAWSPIAKGALAGKLKANTIARKMDGVFRRAKESKELLELLKELSSKYSCKTHQIALAWLVEKGALPIPGVKKPEQAVENALAGDLRLDKQDIKQLDTASEKYIGEKIDNGIPRYIPNWLQRIILSVVGGI